MKIHGNSVFGNKGFFLLILPIVFLTVIPGCGKKSADHRDVRGKDEDGRKKEMVIDFPDVEGWKFAKLNVYAGEELYGPIDGEAERFIHYGFEMAWFGSYEEEGDGGIIDVQVYRMSSPDNAFGIFSMYDSQELRHDIFSGEVALSAWSDGALELAKGNYFVRISQHSMDTDPELLEQFGLAVAGKLEGEPHVPAIVSFLPEGHIEGTVRYFHRWETYRELNYDMGENVLNLSEQTEGVQASYNSSDEQDNRDVVLIVKYTDAWAAGGTFRQLLKFFIDDGYKVTGDEKGPVTIEKEGKPFAGTGLSANYVCAVLNVSSGERAKQLLEETLKKLGAEMKE